MSNLQYGIVKPEPESNVLYTEGDMKRKNQNSNFGGMETDEPYNVCMNGDPTYTVSMDGEYDHLNNVKERRHDTGDAIYDSSLDANDTYVRIKNCEYNQSRDETLYDHHLGAWEDGDQTYNMVNVGYKSSQDSDDYDHF